MELNTLITVEVLRTAKRVLMNELVKSCFGYFSKKLRTDGFEFEHSQDYFTKSLENNLIKTATWSKYLLFYDIIKDKYTATKYVELDFYLRPLRESRENASVKENLLEEVFKVTEKHIIILGDGGSGKSTSMQMLCTKLLTNENYLPNSFPLVVRFRDYSNEIRSLRRNGNSSNILYTILYHELGLPIKHIDKNNENNSWAIHSYLKTYVHSVLNYLEPVVILDGFDEIEQASRPIILNEIKELCLGCCTARIVVTSRVGEFDYSIENAHKFQLAPFDDHKIRRFCIKWLEDEENGIKLYNAIKDTPYYDTTMRPINLTMLASIYEADNRLPDDPKSIYERIIDLHLFRWDKARNINRDLRVKEFDTSVMRQFLQHLAYFLARESNFSFDRYDLESIYKRYLVPSFPFLSETIFDDVINEIEVHSGLFIQVRERQFEFPHKSIQEFLAAKYIAGYQPIMDVKHDVKRLPVEFAIATGLAVNRNYMFLNSRAIILDGSDNGIENFVIYIKRLATEKVGFKASLDLGFEILYIWKNIFVQRANNYDDFYAFFKLQGVESSFILLQELYRVAPEVYLSIRNLSAHEVDIRKYHDSVALILRSGIEFGGKLDKTIDLPLFFVLSWNHIKKTIHHTRL
jgi:hypothetical protein